MPNIVNETKVLISNEESLRMGQANNVTQRLFTLIDAVSSAKTNFGHENCEAQKKKLLLDLAGAQQQILLLNQQLNDHVCWNEPSHPKLAEDPSLMR